MKKFIYIVMAVAMAAMVVSCGGGASTPGDAAKKYAQYVADGNYDKFIEGIYVTPDTSEEEAEQAKAMLKGLLAEKGSKTLEEKGGIKNIEVISEEIAEDGQAATVNLRYTYGNGETSEEKTELVLADGKWMMELDK